MAYEFRAFDNSKPSSGRQPIDDEYGERMDERRMVRSLLWDEFIAAKAELDGSRDPSGYIQRLIDDPVMNRPTPPEEGHPLWKVIVAIVKGSGRRLIDVLAPTSDSDRSNGKAFSATEPPNEDSTRTVLYHRRLALLQQLCGR